MTSNNNTWENVRSSSTTMISLLLPRDTDLSSLASFIQHEISVASNIKSRDTQHGVKTAWNNIQTVIKRMGRKIPDNGIAIFSGSCI
jgi:peptide subunit release factor 1 (eRF1)